MFNITSKLLLEGFISERWEEVNQFIDEWQKKLPISFYSSVDIRESREKFAAIDHNLYPQGFNNVCKIDLKAAAPLFKNKILEINPQAKYIGIISESHTRNLFYLNNLISLRHVLERSDFHVSFLSFDSTFFAEGNTTIELTSADGTTFKVHQAEEKNNIIIDKSTGESIDLMILNNDQSIPININWSQLKTPVVPTPRLGWYRRKKSNFFKCYADTVNTFCEKFGIDPNLLQAKYTLVDNVDYFEEKDLQKLAQASEKLFSTIPQNTKIFIKANQGTYGMGISVVSSPEEVLQINRKIKEKMDIGKNKLKFSSFVLQESVETILTYDGSPAEITIYLADGKAMGGFMRANPERSSQDNLNSKGMVFQKFCISELAAKQDHKIKEAIYCVIARLCSIANAYEILEDQTSLN